MEGGEQVTFLHHQALLDMYPLGSQVLPLLSVLVVSRAYFYFQPF